MREHDSPKEPAGARARSVAAIVCALIALFVGTDRLGPFAHELYQVAELLALILAIALNPVGGTRRGLPAALLQIAGLLLLALSAELRPFATALVFLGLGGAERASPWRALAIGAGLFGCIEFAAARSPLVDYGLRAIAAAASALTRGWSGAPFSVGPSESGLHAMLLALCLVIAAAATTRRHGATACSVAIAAVVAVHLAFLRWFARLPFAVPLDDAEPHSKLATALASVHGALYPHRMVCVLALLLILVVAAFVVGPRGATLPIAREQPAMGRTALALAAVAACAALAFTYFAPHAARERPRALIYEQGFLNWMKPDDRVFGQYAWGMLGMLPDNLNALGFDAHLGKEIDAQTLADTDLLIVINQDHDLGEPALHAIDEFVRAGGAMVVLADHTFIKNGELFANQTLRATDIRFAFDTAEWAIGGWLHSYDFAHHPTVLSLDDHENAACSVIGASLEVVYPAIPLVTGRYGFSDPGDMERGDQGYLSNRLFDPGEALGDVVLVAAEDVGLGRVIAIGDTSIIGNGMFARAWPFWGRLVQWSAAGGRFALPWWRESFGLALLAFVSFGLVRLRHASSAPIGSTFVVLIVAGVISQRVTERAGRTPPVSASQSTGGALRRVALVDESHVNCYSHEGFDQDGVGAIVLNLVRAGFTTIATREFDVEQLQQAAVWTCVSPSDAFEPREVDALARWIESGGTALLCAGWHDRPAVKRLLAEFGLDIAPRPLGPNHMAAADAREEPLSQDAFEIRGGEVLARIWDFPVVVRVERGRGQFVLIGDPYYLRDTNLENEDRTVMANVHYLRQLLPPSGG